MILRVYRFEPILIILFLSAIILIMKKKFILVFVCFVLLHIQPSETYSWGFYGHKRINRMAVLTLPEPMIGFYKKHIDYITEHAVDPDKRRYAVAAEGARHYIDIDHYGANAFEVVPKRWKDAVNKFTEDTLQAYGIVPWHIEKMIGRLTEAFKKENLDMILHYSADLGHYIADAHVPLHTTENYNGQQTNQYGIHGFWESRIPELKAEDYDYFVGKAAFVDNPLNMAWETVFTSHMGVDTVLKFEAKLNDEFPADRKYSYENRGAALMKVYSEEYSTRYDNMMNGMVERRMRQSILAVGSMWYTAWVNAGQPNLERLDSKELSDSLKTAQLQEEMLWKTGKLKGSSKGHED